MSTENDPVKLLNELIRVSEDGEKGFRLAADKADDPALKSLFQNRVHDCSSAIAELQAIVRQLGGTPEDSGSISGAAHRGWVKAKAAIVGDNNEAVLEEVERGEDVAKAAYAKALKATLPINVKAVVDQQYRGVLRNHDRVRELRNQYRAHAH